MASLADGGANGDLGVTVTFGTVQTNGERSEDYRFSVKAVPPTKREEVVNESRFQYTYTGVHDHGKMPELKLGNGMVQALQKAKIMSNEYLTKKIQEKKDDKSESEHAKKKQKLSN